MRKSLLLALLSSFLLWLAWPPTPFTGFILLVAFVPLFIALHEINQSASTKKNTKIALLAFISFFIWNTASIYWVFNSLNAAMPTIIACALALVPFGLAAILMTISVVIYFKIKAKGANFWADVFFISFWISYEYLHQTWDLKFPWMTLGNGFATSTPFIQWYEYTGVYGGSLWVLVSNLLIFSIYTQGILHRKEERTLQKNKKIIWVLWVLVPMAFSSYIYVNYQEEVNPSNVVIVQPNVDPYEKYGSLSASQQLSNLISLSKEKAKVNTEFFLWPETALVGFEDERTFRQSDSYKMAKSFLISYKNATLISGAETYLSYNYPKTSSANLNIEDGLYYDSFNSAVAIENSDRLQFYHKSKLVPGVEKMPFTTLLSFLKPVFEKFGGTTGGYGEQTEPSNLFAQSGIAVVPVICYESIWGEWIAKSVQKGGQFIAIITNDAWWGNTSGKNQHLVYARLRAIENRRWVVRAANTGISGAINERGDIVQQTNWWQKAVINQDINLNSSQTFYTQYPDVLVYPFLIMAMVGLLYLIFERGKRMIFVKKSG